MVYINCKKTQFIINANTLHIARNLSKNNYIPSTTTLSFTSINSLYRDGPNKLLVYFSIPAITQKYFYSAASSTEQTEIDDTRKNAPQLTIFPKLVPLSRKNA